tara:strand:- start:409 stop:1308 length:900 start_codon:yes stop_codon:yes gene_type:complete
MVIALIIPKSLVAQEYFSLNIDNDLYFMMDHYYSSGIFLQYGKQLRNTDSLNDTLPKKYVLWELGQEIYTPSLRYTSNSAVYDYPYGGWTSLKLTFQKELSKNKQHQWGIQLGATGDASGAQWMQNTYHRLVLGLPELPWTDEVPQAFHLNVFADTFKRWYLHEQVAVQSHVFGTVGSQKISGGAALGFVLGKQTVLSKGGNVLIDQQQGDGLYFGVRLQYIAHDYMLSGSLFNDNAPFTLPVNPFRAMFEAGYAIRKNDWRFAFTYFTRSPDNKVQPQQGHHYLNITLSRFFDSKTTK